jgi:hypothetical protein
MGIDMVKRGRTGDGMKNTHGEGDSITSDKDTNAQ